MNTSRRAYIIFHPQTSGGRMLAMAFTAAGCFGDPDFDPPRDAGHPLENLDGHLQRVDMVAGTGPIIPGKSMPPEGIAQLQNMELEDLPDVIVWRRSVPHANDWMDKSQGIYYTAKHGGYLPVVIVIWRTPCETEQFIEDRGTWELRRKAFAEIMEWCRVNEVDPFLVHYDAFVLSPEYRRFVGNALDLPNVSGLERLTYVHPGPKWGDTRWTQ